MSGPRVFVSRRIPESGLARILDHCRAEVWEGDDAPPRETLFEKTADCEGLLTLLTDPVDAALMDACPKLRVVSNYAVGFNNVDVEAATARGIAIGNTPGVLTSATADMAFCLLMAAARCLGESTEDVRAGRWLRWEPRKWVGQDLEGKTLGIVGLGRIGHRLAQRCVGGWGMKVLYHNRSRNEAAEAEFGARRVAMDELLASSDFVSVHAVLDDSTRGLFDRAAFAAMKPSAVFINTARGPIVDHDALADALDTAEIFGAGLDVTDPEPLSADHRLVAHPRCIVAPHVGSATTAARDGMARIAAENLIRGLEGRPLEHAVNPEVTPGPRGG